VAQFPQKFIATVLLKPHLPHNMTLAQKYETMLVLPPRRH